jgi:integrase
VRKLIRNGQDPAEIKREQKRQKKAQSEHLFGTIAREWHEQNEGRWTTDHAHRVLGSLEKEVFPYICSKPIHEITAPKILEVVRRVEKRGALDLALRLLQRISSIYRYGISTGRVSYNPTADLAGSLKTRKVTHRAALSRADLPEFLKKLDTYNGHPLTWLALRLIVLTFVRSSELCGARWRSSTLNMQNGVSQLSA